MASLPVFLPAPIPALGSVGSEQPFYRHQLLLTKCLMVFPPHVRIARFWLLLCLSSFAAISLAQAPAISQTIPAPGAAPPPGGAPVSTVLSLTQSVKKTVLPNGLTVLTKEVDSAPVVSVQVWYRIGSRNEAPGVNGIAHQLEHLMFKGTRDRPVQFGRFLSALGSESNAFTSYDMTAYFGTVEQTKLAALLTLEADRMENAIIGASELESEKRVVISELQGYENSPDYRLERAVMRAALPNSPYGLPVGGTKADVQSFTVEQVRDYYKTYYRPDNATLVIVGNFKTAEALQLVAQTFGQVPLPPTPLPPPLPPPLPRPETKAPRQPIVLREPGSAALLKVIYPLPSVRHPDVPALHVLDYILTGGRSSRLYQALVEQGLASEATGYVANMISDGWYDFSVTANPGQDLRAIDRELQALIATLQTQAVAPEELARAKSQLRAAMILRNQDINSQAMQLGDDQTTTGDHQYTDRLLADIERVSIADVQRVAKTYFWLNERTVGFFEPTTLEPGANRIPAKTQTGEQFTSGEPVDPAELVKYLPAIAAPSTPNTTQALPETLTLKNGLRVLLLRDRSTPTVTLSGFVQAGAVYDQPRTAGLAELTADNLLNGTTGQSALEIAKILENRGAELQFQSGREGVSIRGAALAEDLPTVVDVVADVVQNATFPADELELSRQRALAMLKTTLDTPGQLARRVFQQAVYPANHPYHVLDTAASLQAITREQVVQFYQQHYRPDATVLTLVGDFDPAAVRSLLAQKFGNWANPADSPTLSFPEVPLPMETVRLSAALPGKSQAVTLMGYDAIARTDSRYYAAEVLNHILGGDTLSSRLGTEIRDRQGLTYGIYSMFQAGKHTGPFLIYMQTAPEDADRAIVSTYRLLRQLRDQGVTAAEVATAKRAIAASYPVELAAPSSLAETLLLNSVYGLTPEEIRQYPAKIQAVTHAQVNQLIQSVIHPERLVIVTAGPPTAKP